MRRKSGAAVLVVMLAFGPVLLTATPATALPIRAVLAPTDEGLRYESHSIFTLDSAAHAVHVQVNITVTNQKPGYTSAGYVNSFYFPRIGGPVLPEAANFVATKDGGTSLPVSSDGTDDPRLNVATV